MEVTLLSSNIRHVVIFEPDPNNKHMPTPPRIVATPYIRDLTEIPEGVRYIFFAYVVENEMQMNDRKKIVVTKPFKKSGAYLVFYPSDRMTENFKELTEIPVHESYVGKFRVYGDERQLQEQQLELA